MDLPCLKVIPDTIAPTLIRCSRWQIIAMHSGIHPDVADAIVVHVGRKKDVRSPVLVLQRRGSSERHRPDEMGFRGDGYSVDCTGKGKVKTSPV